MPHCHTLLRAAIALTQNNQRRIIPDVSIAIVKGADSEGYIADIGTAGTVNEWTADHVIDLPDHMIIPGLINAHAHCAMTLMRGFADDLPLLEWLENGIFPLEARLTPELVRLGSLLGHAEMLASGITSCMDMYIFEHSVFEAGAISGLRLVGGEAIFSFSSAACGHPLEALEKTRDIAYTWRENPRLSVAVNPHGVYTTDAAVLVACRDLALELACPLHMHLAETRAETALCEDKWGMRPLAWCEHNGLLNACCSFAHMVDLTPAELDLIAASDIRVAHNPSSNMKLASGVAPVPDMLQRGIPVGLGTDGPASNNRLNMFTEMGRCAILHKCASGIPSMLGAQKVLDMATLGGAAVLGRPDLGVLMVGAPADLAAVRLDTPNMLPLHSPVSQLVYAATGNEVSLTMVGGEILYRDGKFTRFDFASLAKEVQLAAKLLTRT